MTYKYTFGEKGWGTMPDLDHEWAESMGKEFGCKVVIERFDDETRKWVLVEPHKDEITW